MTEVSRLRDSTQILLPSGSIDGLETELEERCVVTVHNENSGVKIVGSPVEIKNASAFLTRNGIAVE